jgi:hypothetical protein
VLAANLGDVVLAANLGDGLLALFGLLQMVCSPFSACCKTATICSSVNWLFCIRVFYLSGEYSLRKWYSFRGKGQHRSLIFCCIF